MKILFLQPLVPQEKIWGRFKKGGGFVPPLGLVSMAGHLDSKGYDVTICDAQLNNFTEKDLENYLIAGKYDLIGISASFTSTLIYSFKAAEICKRILPNSVIVFGGVHATIMPKQVLKECSFVDIVVIGEGEYIIEDIILNIQSDHSFFPGIKGIAYREKDNQIVVNERPPLIENFDKLPLPAYHLLDMSQYIPHATQYKLLPNFPVIIQRGCPFNCAFCSAHIVHGRKVRFKSVQKTIAELKLLKKRYKARGIYFQDSTFTINKNFIKLLCETMIKENLNLVWACNTRVDCVDEELLKLMKRSGCWLITYGVESGNQKSLDLLSKGFDLATVEKNIKLTLKLGINTLTSYILCIPGESYEDSLNTIKFAKKLASPMALFYLPLPYPGTDLKKICEQEEGLKEGIKWSDYSMLDPSNLIYVNSKIGEDKMKKLLSSAYKKYYTSPRVIYNNILFIRSLSDIRRYFVGLRALLGL
ncbi:B12-binding domain-containing radical SAM protein [Candidatus Parcubacteria bacterium]|nr:B12-binding domain-containing radical SAM protein [Candidatus Parcubacteria bacterium]